MLISPAKKSRASKKSTPRKRKWDEKYIIYGFFMPKNNSSLPDKQVAQCMFCQVTYSSQGWVPSKLQGHLDNKHSEHKNKSEKFFKDYYQNHYLNPRAMFSKTLLSFTKFSPALLSSIDAAYYLLQNKKPYTDAENFKPLLFKIVERFFGTDSARKTDTIPLSDTTMSRRCILVATDLKEQLLEKLRLCNQFSIQLDESVDVSGEAQLLVYCRFPDTSTNRMSEHMLYCGPVGIRTTGECIFKTLEEFFTVENLKWENCVAVTTDGAAAMVGRHKGLNAFIREKNPDCQFLHCMLHREALVAKKMTSKESEEGSLVEVFSDVVKIINEIRTKPTVSRSFTEFCKNSLAEHDTLILHSEVRFLSRGMVLQRFILLQDTIKDFLDKNRSESANYFKDLEWLGKIHYLSSIFNELNLLNKSLQGSGGDIFSFIGKINSMKQKLTRWVEKVENGDFSMLPGLKKFLQTCQWETEHPALERELKRLVKYHFNLLSENFSSYFPENLSDDCHKFEWIMNPFIYKNYQKYNLDGNSENQLIDICNDKVQEAIFHKKDNYTNFWVEVLQNSNYSEIAKKAISKLVIMPTTYLAEKGFSALVNIKTRKRNKLKNIDELMRGALETEIKPRIEKIAQEIEPQSSSSSKAQSLMVRYLYIK